MSDSNSSRYNKVIELGQLALKAAILINGVAAISLLPLIGSILATGKGFDAIPPLIAYAIGVFGLGVLVGAMAIGMGYLSELYAYQGGSYDDIPEDKISAGDYELKKELDEKCVMYLNIAKWLVYGSFTSFGIGIVLYTLAFLCY